MTLQPWKKAIAIHILISQYPKKYRQSDNDIYIVNRI